MSAARETLPASEAGALRRRAGARPAVRRLLVPAGHIVVLTSFAVAQPLFYLFSHNAAFFAVRGSAPRDILVFTFGLLLVPPAALLLVEGLAALVGEPVWYAVHMFFIAALSALIVLQAAKRVGDRYGALLLVVAALIGAALAFAYVRLPPVRSFLTVLIPAPFILTALFLFNSPVSRLVFVDDAPAASGTAVEARIPVVVVLFDELSTVSLLNRSEEINAKRFPNFARLADESTFYRDATTVHAFTEHAVPSILTGKLPKQDELPIFADHRQNLFTLLGNGYQIHARESLTHLCPVTLCRPSAYEPFRDRLGSLVSDSMIVYLHVILPGSLREGLPPVDRTWENFRGMTVAGEGKDGGTSFLRCVPVCAFIKHFSGAQPGTLHFLHIQIPHIPWRYLPSGRRYLGDTRAIPGLIDRTWDDDPFLTTEANQRFLLQLGFTDRALGIIVDRLHKTGLYDRALFVVAADHGLSFQPGGPRRDLTPENLHEIAFMPLFIKLPHQADGATVDGFARTIDILPTIADVLGVKIPEPVDGHSLVGRTPPLDGLVSLRGRTDDQAAEAPLSELLRRRAEVLRRQVEVFGDGGWDELYKFGPHSELVGRSLADLDVGDAEGMTVQIDGRALLDSYDPDSLLSPAYMTGRVEGGQPGMDLAVAVNGEIVTTTKIVDLFGDDRIAVFVPEASLKRGQNEVEVLAVQPDGALERLEPAAPELSLEPGVLRRADGTALRLDSGAVKGVLEVVRRDERFVFSGWAADVDRHRPVDSVAIFVEGRLVYVAKGISFRTVEPEQHEGIADTGFRFTLPRGLLPVKGSVRVVRVFAVSGDTAAEFEYSPKFVWKH
jgi:hypothetical protein